MIDDQTLGMDIPVAADVPRDYVDHQIRAAIGRELAARLPQNERTVVHITTERRPNYNPAYGPWDEIVSVRVHLTAVQYQHVTMPVIPEPTPMPRAYVQYFVNRGPAAVWRIVAALRWPLKWLDTHIKDRGR